MVSHKNYHLDVNEDFFISLISKSITYFIDGFILGTKSQSIACLRSGSKHIHIGFQIVELRCTQHGFCGLDQPSRIQGQIFFWSWAEWIMYFGWVQKKFYALAQGLQVMGLALILLEGPFLE